MDEVDSRLAELLKQIKDLTVNFDVPLSRYLDHYVTELTEGLTDVEDEDPAKKVNFAQAGLLLQGAVSVYSKKVEFLWQTVLKMLDFLATRKSLLENVENDYDRDGPEKRKNSRKKKGHSLESSEFDSLIPNFCRNTLLKESDEEMGNVNFISVTPCQLIEKEGKEVKHFLNRVNIHTTNGIDLLGPKEDFQVNAQFNMETVMLGDIFMSMAPEDLTVSLCEDQDFEMLRQRKSSKIPPIRPSSAGLEEIDEPPPSIENHELPPSPIEDRPVLEDDDDVDVPPPEKLKE